MIAVSMIRADPHYRSDAFINGLKRAGYKVEAAGAPKDKRDFLVIWNRYGTFEMMADQWESRGGTVLVAENGYIGKDKNGQQLYALAQHGHNGSGKWPISEKDRFTPLGILVEPMNTSRGGYLLVCGQRGIGSKEMASPPDWHYKIQQKLSRQGFEVKVRLHPGNKQASTKLEDDLAGASACVIWSSGSGVKALTLGIPVIYCAPYWICEKAATRLGATETRSDAVLEYDRYNALRRMADAQWTIEELESGEPFRKFLEMVQ
jgi:hypothetical protein